jgi:predicted O-methyltransferase YrrM
MKNIPFSKKYLPNQSFYKNLNLNSKNEYEESLYNYIHNYLNLKKNSNLKLTNLHTIEEMASNPLMLSIVNFLINSLKKKSLNVLEIGTFLGIFSISLAKNKNVKSVTTIEKFDHFYEIANENFKKNKVQKKINSLLGDGFKVLDNVKSKKFDIIFIDGDKGNYLKIFKKIEKNNLNKNSIVIIDDVFFHGDILNKKHKSPKTRGVIGVLNYLKNKINYNKTILPIYGGVLLIQRI